MELQDEKGFALSQQHEVLLKDPTSFYLDPETTFPAPHSKAPDNADLELMLESSEDDEEGSLCASFSADSLSYVGNRQHTEELAHCIAARISEDIFREQRRQVKLQSLEDVIILLAIPRYKVNGSLNHRWPSCQLVSNGESRPMSKLMEDPVTGDVLFCYSRRPLQRFRAEDEQEQDRCDYHMEFYLKCGCCTDQDRPRPLSLYSVPLDEPGVYSLRDGALCKGATAFDTGIIIAFETSEELTFLPIFHYFDEISGSWACKPFVSVSRGRCLSVLAAARRTTFVVETSAQRFLKNCDGDNFHIHWPGCYILHNNQLASVDYKSLVSLYRIENHYKGNNTDDGSPTLHFVKPSPTTYAMDTPLIVDG
eukprot:Protomagalhaensia_sp_Gyna_25__2382@NODE_231_length_4257_cov_153_808440_g167_i2_p2_GENE_NODE_231_length_4257_cov_153_808440_g167_i2NODE_231_length_4257_cov_153_808440_g167_i2_p2_ORF_typecomplete_len366_score40_58_NODE_231_length_4257_cov_153_808440_g167_i230894186